MAIIDFNSSIWSKPWFRRLSPTAKMLFIYLWTNNHKNLTGMYELDFDTIQFETGLSKKQIKDTLSILYPKVKYDINREIVWVVNHVQHQFMRTPKISPKIITGIEKCLISLDNHPFVYEFLKRYDTLSIQYTYCSGGGEGVKCIGEGEEEGEKTPKESIADFNIFYEAYPKKKSKGQAEITWSKLSPTNDLLKEMLIAIESAKNSEDWQKDNGKYIPFPSSWLNNKGWEDEIVEAKDFEIIIDGVSTLMTETEYKQWKVDNER